MLPAKSFPKYRTVLRGTVCRHDKEKPILPPNIPVEEAAVEIGKHLPYSNGEEVAKIINAQGHIIISIPALGIDFMLLKE